MIEGKKVSAIILVAGNSTRFGGTKNKNLTHQHNQRLCVGTREPCCFRNKNLEIIKGKKVLSYSIEAFNQNSYIDDIIIAVKEPDMEEINAIIKSEFSNKNIKIVLGGNSRKESVYNCIKETNSDIVIIHDGARPAIKQEYINKCIESMKDFKGVTIGVKSKDTIKITDENNIVIDTTRRSNTWIIQTPQCFDRKLLQEMHEKYRNDEVTDDCMLLEKNDYKIKIIEGDYTNIKITTYEDLDVIRNFI